MIYIWIDLGNVLTHRYLPYDVNEALGLLRVEEEFRYCGIVLCLFTDDKKRRIVLGQGGRLHLVEVLLQLL